MSPSQSTPVRHAFDRRDLALAIAALAVGVCTRLHFLLTSPDRAWPHSALFEGDAPLWARWAGDLAAGRIFERGLAVHVPGVAYLLRVLGCSDATTDFTGAKVFWCVVSGVGCGAAYLAFRLQFSRTASAIGAALVAFSFSSLVAATSLNGEALYAAILPLLAIGTLALGRVDGPRRLIGVGVPLGVCHGVATLIRPEHTLLLLLLMGHTLVARCRTLRGARPVLGTLVSVALPPAVCVLVCLPWTLSTAAATERFNAVPERAPVYARASPPWTDDARAYLDSLPAFARDDNFQFLSALSRSKGIERIDRATVEAYFSGVFGVTPGPLAKWRLASGQGPLSFALANHPQATGGFNKAALATPFGPDPELKFSYPPHVALYNHGYRAGWDWIRADPRRWGMLVVRKLAIFADGATQGLTCRDWPLGRDGVRRAVDQFTATSPAAAWWRGILGLLLATGVAVAARRRVGGFWLLVLLYKVAVTVAFYGYARQAASILPAFAVFVALGVEAATSLGASLPPRWRGRASWLPWLWAVPVLALLAADLLTVPVPMKPAAPAAARPAPRWGQGAWEAVEDVRLNASPTR